MVSRRRFLALATGATTLLAGCQTFSRSPIDARSNVTTEPRASDTSTAPITDASASEGAPDQNRLLDIRDFGAAVDGRSDDTQAVRDAIAAAESEDLVFFPRGETVVSANGRDGTAAIELDGDRVPKGLTLSGAGYQSVVRIAGDQPRFHETIFLDVNSGFEDLVIRDMRLDGNKTGQSIEPGTGGHGIKSNNANSASVPVDVRLSNLWVENFNMSGVKVRHAGVTIEDCTVRGCVKHGLAPDSSQDVRQYDPPIVIRRCLCAGNGNEGNQVTYGIDCSGGKIVVEDTVCESNAQGTKTTADAVDITYRRVRLKDNAIFGYIRPGTEVPNRGTVTFEDVVSEGNGESGFRFDSDTDYEIPTEIVATGNDKTNIWMTSDARITANRVWSNRSRSGFGLFCDSSIGGEIESYHPYENEKGPLQLEAELRIENQSERDKTDLDSVPTAADVGARYYGILPDRL